MQHAETRPCRSFSDSCLVLVVWSLLLIHFFISTFLLSIIPFMAVLVAMKVLGAFPLYTSNSLSLFFPVSLLFSYLLYFFFSTSSSSFTSFFYNLFFPSFSYIFSFFLFFSPPPPSLPPTSAGNYLELGRVMEGWVMARVAMLKSHMHHPKSKLNILMPRPVSFFFKAVLTGDTKV